MSNSIAIFVFTSFIILLSMILQCKKKSKKNDDSKSKSTLHSDQSGWEFIEVEWFPDQEQQDSIANTTNKSRGDKTEKSMAKSQVKHIRRATSKRKLRRNSRAKEADPFNPQYDTINGGMSYKEQFRQSMRGFGDKLFNEQAQMGPGGRASAKRKSSPKKKSSVKRKSSPKRKASPKRKSARKKEVEPFAPEYQTLADFHSQILDQEEQGKPTKQKEVDPFDKNYQTLNNLNSNILDEKAKVPKPQEWPKKQSEWPKNTKAPPTPSKPKEVDPFAPQYQTLAGLKSDILDAPIKGVRK